MANTSTLEQIADLVQQVTPLGGKRRGMPIEAEDWNTVVNVLTEILGIDRLQESGGSQALESRFAAVHHEHVGDVASDWLAADLQSSFGGLGVEARRSLAEMNARLQALSNEVARLTNLTQTQQGLLDQAQVADFDRDRLMRSLDSRFGTVDSLRTLVDGVSTQVTNVSKNVDTVLELRRVLTDPQGTPIDFGAIRADLKGLQELSENLKGIDGKPVRLKDVELRLSQLQDVTGTGGDRNLDNRIGVSVGAAEERLNLRFADRSDQLRTEMNEANEGRITGLRVELNTTINTQTAEQIAGAETRLGSRLDEALVTNNGQLRAEIVETARQELAIAQTGSEGRLNTQFSNGIAALQQEILTGIDNRIAGQLDRRFGELQGGLDQRIADVQVNLERTIDQTVQDRIGSAVGSIDGRVQELFKSAMSDFDQRVDAVIDRGLERANLNERIIRIVDDRLNRRPTLNPDEIRGLLDGLIAERDTVLVKQLRGELGDALAAQQIRHQSELQALAGSLRTDIASQQQALVDQVGLQLRSEVSTLRVEFNQTLDNRLLTRPVIIRPHLADEGSKDQ